MSGMFETLVNSYTSFLLLFRTKFVLKKEKKRYQPGTLRGTKHTIFAFLYRVIDI